jgi:hypothetical protein
VSGLVVPAGSSLAQFEIQRYADGVVAPPLPVLVWVDAAKPLRSDGTGIACGCQGPFFPIRAMADDGVDFPQTIPGHTPSVCRCMGSFIE